MFKNLQFYQKIIVLLWLGFSAGNFAQAATDCNQVTEIPVSECQSLLELYNSTNGANWRNNTGWNKTNTPCSWFGVSCSAGYVQVINLVQNALTGILSNLNLPKLQELNLSYNQLSGNIPNFNNLPYLQYFTLVYNQLSGNIPDFNNLPYLRQLVLGDNQLSGNIPNFTNLPYLRELSLQNNQLSGSIPNFTNLPNLKQLWLFSNQLSGNIPNFNNSPYLQWLRLNSNQLSGVIPDFTSFNLTEAFFNNNCGLTAYNAEQEAILNQKDPTWKTQNSNCPAITTVIPITTTPAPVTTTPTPVVIAPTPTFQTKLTTNQSVFLSPPYNGRVATSPFTVNIYNKTSTWYVLYTDPSSIISNNNALVFSLAPHQAKTFDISLNAGQMIGWHAISPLGAYNILTSDPSSAARPAAIAAFGLFTIDILARGLFTFALPPDASSFDLSTNLEALDDIVALLNSPVVDLVMEIVKESSSGELSASKLLTSSAFLKFIWSIKSVSLIGGKSLGSVIGKLFGGDIASAVIGTANKIGLDVIDLPQKSVLLWEITKATLESSPEDYIEVKIVQ